MMKALLLSIVMLLLGSAAGAQADFTYDDHGKRDPFSPLVTARGQVVIFDDDLRVNDLTLEGVVADSRQNNVAILNGRIVKVGDQVGPYTVASIGNNKVTLSKDKKDFEVYVKKGGM